MPINPVMEARMKTGLTHKQAAVKLGIPEIALRRLEAGTLVIVSPERTITSDWVLEELERLLPNPVLEARLATGLTRKKAAEKLDIPERLLYGLETYALRLKDEHQIYDERNVLEQLKALEKFEESA